MPLCREIDSEDEAWEGAIDPKVFQQVRDQQEKLRIIAKLEAQNRPPTGSTNRSGCSTDGQSSQSGYPGEMAQSCQGTKETNVTSSKEGRVQQ
eukprot:Skav228452  [mRNA]  locus=scaffold1058:159740:160018:- [translate_table: standard]